MKKRPLRILFLPQTTHIGSSSRARIYAYLHEFKRSGHHFAVRPGASEALDSVFLRGPNLFQKVRWFSAQIFGRLRQITKLHYYDCVYVHRETVPYVFPFTELLLRRFAKRLIFDFDDAIFTPPKRPSWFIRVLSDRANIRRIIQVADRVIVSNSYLAEYARHYQKQVIVIPTCVRFADYQVQSNTGDRLIIGWIGSMSTQHYLELLTEPFQALSKQYDFLFRVVGANRCIISDVPTEIKPWSLEDEVSDVASFTIGVMPLPDDPWTRGKGGYKLIQYLAAGVPAVASRVGVNCEIIKDGVNGFLASTPKEWYDKLERLILDADLRRKFAQAGRKVVRQRYSIESNYPKWLRAVTEW